jgi:Xaa-Pro aminopeptidase
VTPWDQLAESLREAKVDALVVSGMPNVRYLTGFTGSSALVLAMRDGAVFFTDGRYKLQAAQEVRGAKVVTARGPLVTALAASVKRRRLRRLAFESHRASYGLYESLRTALPGVGLKPLSGVVEKIRAVKTADEIVALRRAVDLNSAVFEACLSHVEPGRTERDVADRIESEMRRRGGDKPAFETIVAAGAHSAYPHAKPGLNPLNRNEFIIIDQGVILDGYSSDMTRTVALGGLRREARRVYEAVLEAQRAAIAAVRPGIRAAAVDRQARMVLQKHGLEKAFVHSTGHGVGLEIHEPPRLGRREKTELEPGMVITIEPGVYLEGFGGVRIEDMVVVTPAGCEILTPTPKELRVL